MGKKILIGVGILVVLLIILVAVALKTDSPECEALKTDVCDFCGAESDACKEVSGAIATTDECVQAQGMLDSAKKLAGQGAAGEAGKAAFCTALGASK